MSAKLERISNLVNRRLFNNAYLEALRYAVREDPHNAEAWFYVALAANLSDRPSAAQRAYQQAIHCPNFTPLLDGHFHRDFMLRAIRCRQWKAIEFHFDKLMELHIRPFLEVMGLSSTENLVEAAQKLEFTTQDAQTYQEYANCFAGAVGAVGRWNEAKGDTELALLYHELADEVWNKLDSFADAQWRYNNAVHHLLAVVQIPRQAWDGSQHASRTEKIVSLYSLLKNECPSGAKPRVREAHIMLIPKFGSRLFHGMANIRQFARRCGL
jgi:tetratricopeptide (TPR) repeat protein